MILCKSSLIVFSSKKLFISSFVVLFFKFNVRSIVLPSGTGTVIEKEAIFSLNSGNTVSMTLDELVIDGIIFSPAALFFRNPSPATSANLFEFE